LPEKTASWQALANSESCATAKDSVALNCEFHHRVNLPRSVAIEGRFSGLSDQHVHGRRRKMLCVELEPATRANFKPEGRM